MDFEVLCKALQLVNVGDAFIQCLLALKNTRGILIDMDVEQVRLLELLVFARVIVQVRRLTDQECTHFVRKILLFTTQSSHRNICVRPNTMQELYEIELLFNACLCLYHHILKPATASTPKLCCEEALFLDSSNIGEVPAHL